MVNYPCKGCNERAVKIIDGKPVRCHSYCEKYQAANEEHLKSLEKIEKAKSAEADAVKFKLMCIRNTKKKLGGRK